MSHEPFFSILITTYNASGWIRQAIESVLGQADGDFECLIGDDASTDDTAVTAKSLIDGRFKVIERPENIGGGENFVDLIRRAKGQVIVELGGDDYLANNRCLERIRREYDTFPMCEATSGSLVIVPSGGVWANAPDPLWWKRWCFAKPLTFKRELALRALEQFHDVLIDPQTRLVPRYGWDVAVYYPVVALAKRYRTIYDVIYAYRVHPQNDQNAHRAEQLEVVKRLSDHLDKQLMKPMPWWSQKAKDAFAAR